MSSLSFNPLDEFNLWFQEAQKTKLRYPNAMALATVDKGGIPSVRIVLMKHFDEHGLVFYTNYESKKSHDIKATHLAAVNFHWEELGKQIRITGAVEPVSPKEADEYFATRARDSQLGAWASKQSQTMESRSEFEDRLKDFTKKFEGGPVPRPDGWSGWRIVPNRIEYWIEKPFRLHDRWVYTLKGSSWQRDLLYP
ncbi:MAG: pyridoxamine 5'-phosphate oxidase [Proteobacteria bacterium]|nr:MAG: pyridoxamine 5'-phosphate oxidase [Pseudomonadota bacterium]